MVSWMIIFAPQLSDFSLQPKHLSSHDPSWLAMDILISLCRCAPGRNPWAIQPDKHRI